MTSIIDLVAFATANPGDGILIGRPLYSAFVKDLSTRAGAKLVPVSSEGKDPMGEEMVQQYEKELLKQEKQGTKIRAMILARSVDVQWSISAALAIANCCHNSPHNPLGKCYVGLHHNSLAW